MSLLAVHQQHEDYWIKLSSALDSDYDPPSPEGLRYLGFQKAGIEYAKHRTSVLYGSDMGVGKTVQALGYMNYHLEYLDHVLIVCPDSMKIGWERHCKEWLLRDYNIRYLTSGRKWMDDAEVVILNYELLAKFDPYIKALEWDLLVLDEIHYVKNPDARRTRCIVGGRAGKRKFDPIRAKRRIGLSGTLMENGKPKELIAPLHAIGAFEEVFGNWGKFVNRYCDPQKKEIWTKVWRAGSKVPQRRVVETCDGATNLEELNRKLRSTVMVRHLKRDVLPQLPSKIREVIEIDHGKSAVRKEREQAKGFWNTVKGLEALSDDEFDDRLASISDSIQVAFDQMAAVRRETGEAKLPYVISHIKDLLESGNEKIICFAWHQDIVEAIHEAIPGAVKHYGPMSSSQKQESIDRFQNDPSCRLISGNTYATGSGITLTQAGITVFAEFDWLPGKLLQAEDRSCRIGTEKSSLLYHYIALKDSLDAKMAKAFIRKRRIAERALDRSL